MTLETFWSIFLWIAISLLILAVTVIWVAVIAATWITINKFMAQYAVSARALRQKEAEEAELARQIAEDDIIR